MKKLKLLLATCALMGGVFSANAQVTDVTETYLTNAGFETDEAATALNGSQQDTPTGWTITPSSLSNTQWGTANSSTTIQGLATSEPPSAGEKYFYFRDNWQSGTNISVSQTSTTTVSAGDYFVYIDVFTYSSNGTQPVYSFTVSDGSTTYVNGSITANKQAWATYYYRFKLNQAATLTFSANMTPKAAASGKHDWMLLDNIKLLKADNPAEPISDNNTDLYLYNEATSQYLSAGQSWGTHAIVDNYGQEVTATLNDGVYTLKTQQYNKFLGSDLYMDNGTAANWLFLETETNSGKYYMTYDGVNFMTSNGAGAEVINVTSPTAASVWKIVSKSDRKGALSSTTADNPANATFLIGDANFSRNCLTTPWTKTNSGGDFQFAKGDNENTNMQQWNGTFTLTQAITNAPNGAYKLTAQGYYRNGGNDGAASAYLAGTETIRSFLTANSETPVEIMSVMADAQTSATGGFTKSTAAGYVPNSQSDASKCFSAGYYKDNVIWVAVTDGNLTIGAKCDENVGDAWTVLDNFELTYYGDVTINEAKNAAIVKLYKDAMSEAGEFTEESMWATEWQALQTAITNNTLNLSDPSLTENDITTATANLVAANTAATAAVAVKTTYDNAVTTIDGGTNVDLTSLITNPGFETGNTNGWNNDGAITANAQNNSSFDNKQGTWYAERWHANGTIDINQTVNALPAGVYTVEAYMYSDVSDAKLYVNSEEVSVSTSGKYTATIEIADKGSIKMGASCTLTDATWICLDDFKLTYVGTVNDLTYTLATGKMGTDKSAAQSTAETTFLANKTLAYYNALLTAIAEAEASVANYAKLKTAIDKATAVKDANNFVTAAAKNALESEISTATTAWENVTYTDAQCTAEIATLGTTVSGWHAIDDSGKAGAFMASTWGKTHETWFDAPYINTWSTEGDNDGSGFSVPFFEYFIADAENLPANTFTATLTGLDKGMYEVEIWARVQRRSDADFNSNNDMITMYVNDGYPVSIMSNTKNNVGSGTSVMRLGRYTARGEVTDEAGTLTLSIDVELGSNVHWLSWRDVKYTKLDEATMKITDAEWATFCAPFAVTIPDDVRAYTVDELDSDKEGELLTTPVENLIPANTPVLLNSESVVEKTFYGKAEDNTPVTPNVGLLYGVYTANTAPVGSYVLMNDAEYGLGFYQVDEGEGKQPTVGANRAYLMVPDASRAAFFFDGKSTGLNNVRAKMSEVSGDVYNLNGQRVTSPRKGLYIMNGKKVVVK